MEFDVQLLGDSDTIVAELCRMAGWELKHEKLPDGTSNVPDMDINNNLDGSGKGGRAHWEHFEPYTYVFEGGSLEDIEYEVMLARIAQQGLAGDFDMSSESDGSDADDEGFDTSTHVRGTRFGSADPMETDVSRSTVHGSLPTAMKTTGATGSHVGVAIGTTEPRSGDLAEIRFMHAEELFASHDHSQRLRSDDEIEIIDKYMEKMPHDVSEGRSMSISEGPNDSSGTGSGQDIETSFMLEHRSDAELRAIMEDPLLEEEQEEAKRASDDSDSETLTFHTPNGSFQAPGFLGSQAALNLEEDNDEDLAGLSQQSFHEADLFSQ